MCFMLVRYHLFTTTIGHLHQPTRDGLNTSESVNLKIVHQVEGPAPRGLDGEHSVRTLTTPVAQLQPGMTVALVHSLREVAPSQRAWRWPWHSAHEEQRSPASKM